MMAAAPAGGDRPFWLSRAFGVRPHEAAAVAAGLAMFFLLFTGYYPAAVWLAFVLVGLAVGRLDLRAARVRAGLVGGGAAAAALGHLGGWLSARQLAPGQELAGVETVKVHFASSRIEVDHDAERTSAQDLVDTVAKAGYKSKVSAF